jgi:predicted RNA binding protein YcfA (HicA-like mRNA interferase family)
MSVYEVCILKTEGRAAMHSREVIRRLQQDGWFEVAQAGSHKQFKHPVKPGRVTVPFPKKDVPKGTLKSIEKQAGLKLT